uniref:C-type lectin domain-containing protein n=1 Tax=Callorhinchus milii TaxID=7868 RepID=A0A4W3HQT7_CALMI
YRIDQQKNWTEARDYCQNYHTDLISIGSPEEHSLISKLFDGDMPLWIGLYNINQTVDGWKWINGDRFSFAHWRDKEMNRYPGFRICVAMTNGLWFGDYCNQTHWFTCYKGYHLIDQRKSWSEARDYCRKQHTDLVSIRNSEEQKVFTSMFVRDVALWIGLYNNNRSETGWKWINGDKVNYTHWKEKEPNGYRGAMICVAVRNGLWLSETCFQSYRFVCYTDLYPKIETPIRVYYRIDRWKNWTEALIYCRNHCTDLISIQNQQEYDTTLPLFVGDTPMWIGLYSDKQYSAGWNWTNGDKFSYSHWKNKYSTDMHGWLNCVAVEAGFWVSEPCYQTYRFICYTGRIRKYDDCTARNTRILTL